MAKTVASGMSVRLKAHPSVLAKWSTLRTRCSFMRLGFKPGRNSGLASASIRRMRTPAALRIDRISNTENVTDSSRTATAVAEKEKRAPVIQRTTARMLRWDTGKAAGLMDFPIKLIGAPREGHRQPRMTPPSDQTYPYR